MTKAVSIAAATVILALAIAVLCPQAQAGDLDGLLRRFDALDLAINGGKGYASHNNEDGTLAWSESYLLEAYLDMWDATHERRYLDKFAEQARQVVRNTDRQRGVQDYKGRTRAGWGSTIYYVKNVRMVDLVESGMILSPLTRFAWIVKYTAGMDAYRELADEIVKLSKDALQEFEPQWRVDEAKGEGYYVWEQDAPLKEHVHHLLAFPMPVNYLAGIGRTLLWTSKVTGNADYWAKAERIAAYIKHGLKVTDNGAYIWHTTREEGKRIEDLSHGAMDLEFILLAYRNAIVFGKEDITRFVHTFLKNVVREGKLSWYIDASAEANREPYRDAVGRWLELAEYNCGVYRAVYELLSSKSGKQHPQVLLGVAKLVKYSKKCELTD